MIDYLKKILEELNSINKKEVIIYRNLNTDKYICALECAIEILEKIKYIEI